VSCIETKGKTKEPHQEHRIVQIIDLASKTGFCQKLELSRLLHRSLFTWRVLVAKEMTSAFNLINTFATCN
jgi:hypothetical protein